MTRLKNLLEFIFELIFELILSVIGFTGLLFIYSWPVFVLIILFGILTK